MRYLFIFLFSVQILHAEAEFRVAIFGTNYIQEDSIAGFADPLLAKLFSSIRSQRPSAVFFTGDLEMSLENSGTLTQENFKRQLDVFSNMKNRFLGKDIPIYPTLGNHHQANYEIIETFREHFNINKISPRPPYHLAYTVGISSSEFIVLATGFDEPDGMTIIGTKPGIPILDWLEKYLEINAGAYKYRFVLSHFPAFSSTAPSGVYLGLDKDSVTRDIFWSILRKNHINAYFCSYEPFYDRSNREGIWQVSSGGIVNRGNAFPENKTFSHYLILKWGGENQYPVLTVFDIDGREWDSFNLIPLNFPVHQMRISDKF